MIPLEKFNVHLCAFAFKMEKTMNQIIKRIYKENCAYYHYTDNFWNKKLNNKF
jgi:hypothetical protein